MNKLASVYAKALFDLNPEPGSLESVSQQLAAFCEALKENPKAREILYVSRLSKEEKKKIIGSALNSRESAILRNFLWVMIDNGRIHLLDQVQAAFKQRINIQLGITEGVVTSAVELTPSQLESLSKVFSRKLNKEIRLSTKLDPSLVGGFHVIIDGVVYDNSIKLQLKQLKKHLMETEL